MTGYLMRMVLFVLSVLLAMLAVSSIVGATASFDRPIAVVLTFPDDEYDIDSEVPVNVTVYKRGELFQPDTTRFLVGEAGREVGLRTHEIGRYQGGFSVRYSDLDDEGTIDLSVTIWDGTKKVTDRCTVYTVLYRAFELDLILIDPRDAYPSLGEFIQFQVRSQYMGELVDPELNTLHLQVDDGVGLITDIALEWVGVGRFNGSYLVPPDLPGSAIFKFKYWAQYLDGLIPASVRFEEALLFINPLLDPDGAPVESAQISIEYSYLVSWWSSITKTKKATTDTSGRVVMELDYVDMLEGTRLMMLNGVVTFAGTRQSFTRQVDIPWEEEVPGPGSEFEIRLLTEQPLPLGETCIIEYACWCDGRAMADHMVYAFLYDQHHGYYCGGKMTDANGTLRLTVITPKDLAEDLPLTGMNAIFSTEFSARTYTISSYVGVSDMEIIDHYGGPSDLDVRVHPFSWGSEVWVTMNCLWNLSNWNRAFDPGWEVWTPKHPAHFELVPCAWSDGAYRARFDFPQHLPADSRMFVIGLVRFHDPPGKDLRVAVVEGLTPLPLSRLPTVHVDVPVEGQVVFGAVNITGTAWGGVPVERVEVRVDWWDWQEAEGTLEWTFQLDTRDLERGAHMLQVRSWSGERYHMSTMVNFTGAGPPSIVIAWPSTDESWSGVVEVSGSWVCNGSMSASMAGSGGAPWERTCGPSTSTRPSCPRGTTRWRRVASAASSSPRSPGWTSRWTIRRR